MKQELPESIRQAVIERDHGCCRFCGATVENPAVHHVKYRSEGGQHVMTNLVTVHWMFWPRCHEKIHGNKRLWQPILLAVAAMDGVNALQVRRWTR